ncbi:hypothetical protein AX17_004189 [Amanita inopinata Kibby_2008]|nr:hypothetical protein AX17_004189 [Amanita inopinata Kibby_2008]
MAFPIPDHLPRKAAPQDISSSILNRIDTATNQTLNAELARSWIADLDESINSTKQRIRERIRLDSPEFERQLSSSKSVRERLQILGTNVDTLSGAVSDPESGLIPTVTQSLATHAALAQETTNASVWYQALSHLSKCRDRYKELETLIQSGRLPDARHTCAELDVLLNSAPVALERAKVMADCKRNASAKQALVEEQLSDAYSRGVQITSKGISICPSIQVRQSDTVLSLSSVLSALSHQSLTNLLSTFRRDFVNHFIDHVLREPCSIVVEADSSGFSKLMCTPSLPNDEVPGSQLRNLSAILDFLKVHFLPHLPESYISSFTHTLCKPITTTILNNLLRPTLPTAFDQLPPYLNIVKQAVQFEGAYIIGLLGSDSHDRTIQAWSDGIGGHYERQRRLQILDLSRTITISPIDPGDYFLDEIEMLSESLGSSVVLVQDIESKDIGPKEEVKVPPITQYNDVDAWGFEDDGQSGNSDSAAVEEDSWGLDDDLVESEPEVKQNQQLGMEGEISPNAEDGEPDPGEAWGWNDGSDMPVDDSMEDTMWDDPWAEPSSSNQTEGISNAGIYPSSAAPVSQPKVAARLEKVASKNKKQKNRPSSPPLLGPTIPERIAPEKAATQRQQTSGNTGSKIEHGQSLFLNTSKKLKETYRVSGRMTRLMKLAEEVIEEGKHLSASSVMSSPESASPRGTIILQTAPASLDLFRALYPVKHSTQLKQAETAMAFSNDCLYLNRQVERLQKKYGHDLDSVQDKFEECKRVFKILGESWYDDATEQQKQMVHSILIEGAQGFVDSADEGRYDECESAVNDILRKIRHLANKLKGLLPKNQYYLAIGSVVEAALSKMLQDILALPDIPEVESHKLSELCRILNALEGLFVEDYNQPSFVVAYVPSWLKFSYLSELLEASMADITYLFEVGALVDFSVDELVRLVRALFADTNLRTNTINKILNGHPASSES